MHDGEMLMIDESNNSVLSYVRKGVAGHPAVFVALNFTNQPQTITLDAKAAGVPASTVSTLLTDAPSLQSASSTTITLPPYASWIGTAK